MKKKHFDFQQIESSLQVLTDFQKKYLKGGDGVLVSDRTGG